MYGTNMQHCSHADSTAYHDVIADIMRSVMLNASPNMAMPWGVQG